MLKFWKKYVIFKKIQIHLQVFLLFKSKCYSIYECLLMFYSLD
jgi:hypothetical protein